MGWKDTVKNTSWKDTIAEEPSYAEQALNGLSWLGKKVDSVTGAPVRAGLGELEQGHGLISAGSAALNQFAADPDKAPTGQQLMRRVGVSDSPLLDISQAQLDEASSDPEAVQSGEAGFGQILKNTTRSGASGLALDMVADPTNLIPGRAAFKGLTRGAKVAEEAKLASQAVNPAKQFAKGLFEAPLAENADEIRSAIKSIAPDVTAPDYLLTKDRERQRLASTLLESPTFAGRAERKVIDPIYKGLNKVGEEVSSRAGSLSDFETGEAVRKGIGEKFSSRLAPAEETYNALEDKFAGIPINGLAFKRGANALRKENKTDWTGKTASLIDKIEATFESEVKTVADLKKFRTQMGRYADTAATPAEKSIVDRLYGILTRERNRSILRGEAASSTGRRGTGQFAGAAEKLEPGTLEQLRGADKTYRETLRDTSGALGVTGNSRQGTRAAIQDYIQNKPGEKIAAELFNRGDVGSIRRVQQQFPEEFELLRQNSLRKVMENSTEKGSLSMARLTRNLSKYPKEVQEILLGDLAPQARNASTVLNALPTKFNPSETSIRSQYLNLFSPSGIQQEAQSFATRQYLKTGKLVDEGAAAAEVPVNAIRSKSPSAPAAGLAGYTATMGAARSQNTGPQDNTPIEDASLDIPEITKKLSRSQVNALSGSKYGQMLQEAAKRGGAEAVGMKHYMLSQQDPEYQALMKRANNK